jgi:PAS domain S-box-containing protein
MLDLETLLRQNEELRRQLDEARQALDGIASGEVDSLVFQGPDGPRVYSLEGANDAYRVLVEAMPEGAATLSETGAVLYGNSRFALMLGAPLTQVIGSSILSWIVEPGRAAFSALLERAADGGSAGEVVLLAADGRELTAHLSVNAFQSGTQKMLCVVATDLTERINAEAKLRASEARFRTTLLSIGDGVIATDGEGRIQTLNPVAEALTGWSAAEMRGRSLDEVFRLLDEETRAPLTKMVARVLSGDAAGGASGHKLLVSRDGVEHPIADECTPIRDDKGRTSGVVVVFRDQTVARGLEAQVEERNAQLRSLTEKLSLATNAAEIGIWDWEIAANKLTWDDPMYRLYGVTADTFGGVYEAWQRALHPHDAPSAEAAVQRALSGAAPLDARFRIVTPRGDVRHVVARGTVHRDSTGKPYRMLGTNWDVTAETVAVERLAESERAYRQREALLDEFIRHTPAAIAVFDHQMRYLRVSRRWMVDYDLLGHDIIGKSHYEVFADAPERWRAVHTRVLAGAVECCDEDPYPRRDGATEWLQWEARPWRDSDGTISGLILFTQAVTVRKQLELRLKEQNEKFARSNRELDQFAYAASHDLQEPLRAISGCAQILCERYQTLLDAEGNLLLTHVMEGTNRMKALIEGLLDLARVNAGGPSSASFDGGSAFEVAKHHLGAQLEASGARLTAGSLPLLSGNSIQFVQVLQNLVGNALKYRSTAVPEVVVSAVRDGAFVHFTVSDNGIGIDPQHSERVFEVFQRLHGHDEYPGTGIGLSVCRKIVERHGGQITLGPNEGGGTRVRFSWPAAEPREPAAPPEGLDAPQASPVA